MEADTKRIIEDLRTIKAELQEIKHIMPEKAMFLSAQEARLLEESFCEEKEGTLTSSRQLRKKLGI